MNGIDSIYHPDEPVLLNGVEFWEKLTRDMLMVLQTNHYVFQWTNIHHRIPFGRQMR